MPQVLNADSSDSSELLDDSTHFLSARGDGRGVRWAIVASGLLAVGAVLLVSQVAMGRAQGGRSLRRGDAEMGLDLSSEPLGPAAQLAEDLSTVNYFDVSTAQDSPVVDAPQAGKNDGNSCENDEEMLSGLCYKKCSLLTQGEYPKRTSAWSCCKGDGPEECNIFQQKVNLKICSGFDVGGDRAGNGCPHAAGVCLDNEELHLGRCYMKCSLIDEEYPTRVAAATCCKAAEKWKCLDIMNVKTRHAFDVGGGEGDGDIGTPRHAHLPLK